MTLLPCRVTDPADKFRIILSCGSFYLNPVIPNVIHILAVGKLKESHYRDAADEYLKRLTRYTKIETTEIREQTDKNPQVSKRREAELILAKIKPNSYVITLDSRGKPATSEEFSQILEKPDLTFIIGGPDGLAQEVLNRSDHILSLSKMTFPHQMARVILLEQIYRGHTILNGEKYHR
jgi:23S rRNA (pseudouridine1915-N3)-methyltransferase